MGKRQAAPCCNEVIKRAACVAVWATICWEVRQEDDPHSVLIGLSSGHYPERKEKGELLCKVTEKGLAKAARC
jgi:hypothetical protein